MTIGILYVLHGRRDKIATANLELIQKVQTNYAVPQAIGFLEGTQQTLEQGLDALKQVDHLIVLPLLLFAATHLRWDLPKRLAQAKSPHQQQTILQPLGTAPALFSFLEHQLRSSLQIHPQRKILLVAHGTGHFKEPLKQLETIGQQLQLGLNTSVTCCNYVGVQTVATIVPALTKPLLVQPLFLTDGRIVHAIKTEILKSHPESIFLPTLENQPALELAIHQQLTLFF